MKKIIIILAILVLLVSTFKILKTKEDLGGNQENIEVSNNVIKVTENPDVETDPAKMTLGMKTWDWQKAIYSDGREVRPLLPGKFKLTFNEKNKTFSASTDCNNEAGDYKAVGTKMTFETIISNDMYCEGSQEAVFSQLLVDTEGFLFTSKGELVLKLKVNSGSVYFR
jgi:heat shock protein HslJ